MEYRYLGQSGLKVPALGLGTGTFGGQGPLFSAWGQSGADHARRMIDICLDAGLNLFDSADVYSDGASEAVLGEALAGIGDPSRFFGQLEALGLRGTPAYLVGPYLIEGGLNEARLAQAVRRARAAGPPALP